MQETTFSSFNSKILLFGEYSLMVGSMALSIPFERYHGELVLPGEFPEDENERTSNHHIKNYLKHLNLFTEENNLEFTFNLKRLSDDAERGLFFKSNIPQGYGLGSSGALVAAIFKAYGELDKPQFTDPETLLKLKYFFSKIESYFHGKSSGLDPLISFLNQAVLVSGKDRVEIISNNSRSKNGKGAVFLIDSGHSGETEPLVKHFQNRYESTGFKHDIDKKLVPLVNQAIDFYLTEETLSLLSILKQISALQLKLFQFMIPTSVSNVWKKGLETHSFYLKLCGSGGGGMMLGFTDDIKSAKKYLGAFNPIIIHQL